MSRKLFVLGFVASMLCLAGRVAWADGPATQPVAAGADTPRRALMAFVIAYTQGRPDDVAPLCVARDADSRQLVTDLTDLSAALGKLREAVNTHFGSDAVATVVPVEFGPPGALPDDLIEAIHGDEATLTQSGDEDGPAAVIKLVKSDGHWKVDIASLIHEMGLMGGPNPHLVFSKMAKLIQGMADDVSAGKFPNAEVASTEMKAREQEMTREYLASQSVTTRP